ncbi:MAG: DUF2924 domain-containing protein [Pseudolabrys sp.]
MLLPDVSLAPPSGGQPDMAQPRTDLSAIDGEIDRIRSLGVDALRAEWQATFGRLPPDALTRDLIGRMVAYRIQESAFGGLDRQCRKLLDQVARGENPELGLNRRLKPGAVLVREHQGERHTVTVVPDGFVWREVTYPSLSAIARAITGTAWNGHRFFGLREAGTNMTQVATTPKDAAHNEDAGARLPRRRSGRSRRR